MSYQASALSRLFEESASLFHRLRLVAAQVHGRGEFTAGRRGILRILDRRGPLSVPQIARARFVSRQHIQTIVNALLEDGLVTARQNPAHLRSPLILITAKGRRDFQAMQKREQRVLAKARLPLPDKKISDAADTLRSVCHFFETNDRSKS